MSDWKTVDDFAKGIDGNRLPRSSALVGTRWVLRHDDGVTTELSFVDESTVNWSVGDASGTDRYDAVEGVPGTFFVERTTDANERVAEVHVVHVANRRVLTVESTIAAEKVDGVPQVSQRFRPGVLDLGDGVEASGEAPAETRELIGFRALYRYSPNHLYEHVYLSSTRYAWQCLVGEQFGHGDVDLATAYKIADNQYVFTFREFRIPVATTWLYDMDALRTTGAFFGLSGAGDIRNAPGGAFIIPLGRVSYPNEEPV
ncbi:molybdenum cofactor biosynthesis F family protein [Saccharothrix violaceirubra]|uniref:Molybdenum cofactor biosynthesis protein F n=1 Tax=Saccharothrix violaceirubra TaxID=413306 RepID=A0A7W7T2A0_9PSEU|nr:molybdenum cofactor biosynthesis F family protein [Saccharothrix violaceirubra]MBB4965244.1 hypothetical protein [Saccharothrix violaceirubra]